MLVVAGVSGVVALAIREWPAVREARAARTALAAGRFEDARPILERWVELRPGSAEAHYLRARVALALGRRDDLSESMRLAQKLGLSADQLALLRALVDVQFGRYVQAREPLRREFDRAETPDPQLDEGLARVYMETYDFPNALKVLERWIRDAPDHPEPHVWRAVAHGRMDADPEVIIADYREALRRDSGSVTARLGLASTLGRIHRNAEAAREFDAYLALVPGDPAGHLGAGRNALELGNMELAARRIGRALELDPGSAEAHTEHAKLDQRSGDEAGALGHLDKAIELKPADPALRYSRKLALIRLGRLAEAEQEQRELDRVQAEVDRVNELQARLAEAPKDASLQNQIALWMFDHGYPLEGVKWAEKILSDHPGHPKTCAMLAAYYERLGMWQKVNDYQAQARRRPGPGNPGRD